MQRWCLFLQSQHSYWWQRVRTTEVELEALKRERDLGLRAAKMEGYRQGASHCIFATMAVVVLLLFILTLAS